MLCQLRRFFRSGATYGLLATAIFVSACSDGDGPAPGDDDWSFDGIHDDWTRRGRTFGGEPSRPQGDVVEDGVATLFRPNTVQVKFADVAGIDTAKDELVEIVEFLKNPAKFNKLGARMPKGVLLSGPPGTGKTLLARSVAGEAGVAFISTTGSSFIDKYVGEASHRVRKVFELARKNAPCIIFIDEIDGLASRRSASPEGGGDNERNVTINQLLTEMDGFNAQSGIIVIAATNLPNALDPALLRAGRLDRRVHVSLPDESGRIAILGVHTRNKPLAADVNLDSLGKETPGLSGADLENVVNEAAIAAARRGAAALTKADFDRAIDRTRGIVSNNVVQTDAQRLATAAHEAGHVVVASLLKEHPPLQKVTIEVRGAELGGAKFQLSETDNISKGQIEAMIAVLLSGRLAEQVLFGKVDIGAVNDIQKATRLAQKMVREFGMSSLGAVVYPATDEAGRAVRYSDATERDIEREVSDIVKAQAAQAEALVKANIRKIKAVAAALFEKKTLTPKEVADILAAN